MKSIGDIEEDLADKTEPILGFRPSSKIKRGPIGIVISIICVVIVLLEFILKLIVNFYYHDEEFCLT